MNLALPTHPRRMIRIRSVARAACRIITIVALFTATFIFFDPVLGGWQKTTFLTSALTAWTGMLILTWEHTAVRRLFLLLSAALATPFFLPGREIQSTELGKLYVEKLSGYEGVMYSWGGENSLGIDCSGLTRRALRDALWSYGWKHANGRAFRMFAEQWWFDASAGALQHGYRNYTKYLGLTGTIREIDCAPLVPGDLAVTKDGVHILAYTGRGKWIQADPGIGSVAILDGHKDENRWFACPVTLHRWQVLEQTCQTTR